MSNIVHHVIWGRGTVTFQDGKYLKVNFENSDIGEKTFVYPDAFAKYISYDDASLQAEVEEILKLAQKQAEERAASSEQAVKEAAAKALEKEKTVLAKKRKAIAYSRKRAEKLRVKSPADISPDEDDAEINDCPDLPDDIPFDENDSSDN